MFLNFKTTIFSLVVILACALNISAADRLHPINLDITTQLGDQQIFHAGDNLSFMISLDQDAYVYLFYQDAENHLLQLLPSALASQHFFNSGYYLPIPDARAAFSFKVQPPFGSEQVWAFAIDKPVAIFDGKTLDNGLVLMSKNIDQIRQQLKARAERLFDESSKTIETRP
jgi:hypothetical protein